jgi:hypothetical protein
MVSQRRLRRKLEAPQRSEASLSPLHGSPCALMFPLRRHQPVSTTRSRGGLCFHYTTAPVSTTPGSRAEHNRKLRRTQPEAAGTHVLPGTQECVDPATGRVCATAGCLVALPQRLIVDPAIVGLRPHSRRGRASKVPRCAACVNVAVLQHSRSRERRGGGVDRGAGAWYSTGTGKRPAGETKCNTWL